MLVRDLRELVLKAAGQDKAADSAVCLVSKLEERRSKQACSGIAIALQAARKAIVQAAILARIRFALSGKSEYSGRGRVAPP